MCIAWPASALAQWPEERAGSDSAVGDSGPLIHRRGRLLFRGPRLKMGVCEGFPSHVGPDDWGRADYVGASVNQASRIMSAGGEALQKEKRTLEEVTLFCPLAAAQGGMVACEEDLAVRVLGLWNQAAQNIDIGNGRGAMIAVDHGDSSFDGMAVEKDEYGGGEGEIGPLSVIPEGRQERATPVSTGERTSVCLDVRELSLRPPPAYAASQAATCSSPRQSGTTALEPFAAATGNLSLAATQAHQGTPGERAPRHPGDRSSAPHMFGAAERSAAAVAAEGVAALRLGQFKFVGSPSVLPIVHVTRVALAGRRFPNESPRGKGIRVEAAGGGVAAVSLTLPPLKGVDLYRQQLARAEAQRAAVHIRNHDLVSRSASYKGPLGLLGNPRSSCPPSSEASPRTVDNLGKPAAFSAGASAADAHV